MSQKKRLSRRSFLELIPGVAATYMGSLIGGNTALAQVTDSDSNDRAGNGRGTGLTDSDANDRAGYGRGGYSRASGVTDPDANDRAGNGRGC